MWSTVGREDESLSSYCRLVNYCMRLTLLSVDVLMGVAKTVQVGVVITVQVGVAMTGASGNGGCTHFLSTGDTDCTR